MAEYSSKRMGMLGLGIMAEFMSSPSHFCPYRNITIPKFTFDDPNVITLSKDQYKVWEKKWEEKRDKYLEWKEHWNKRRESE